MSALQSVPDEVAAHEDADVDQPVAWRRRLPSPWVGVAALAVLGATAVGLRWAARPPATIENVRMGPGGWVSLKNVPGVRPSPDASRPWWAKALGAERVNERLAPTADSVLTRAGLLRALRKESTA